MVALTDSGTLVRMAYQGLINLDVDADEVLRRCGLDEEQNAYVNVKMCTPYVNGLYFTHNSCYS